MNVAHRTLDISFRLTDFEGPLDLLLQLIERHELDITRVSLAHVADQYLELVTKPGAIELSQLGDYLVIAARLILIKSRSLLPHPETDSPVADEEDVANTLARQLREYKIFKTAAQFFRERETKGLRSFPRRAAPPKIEAPVATHVENLSFETLFGALARFIKSKPNLPSGKLIEPLSVSIHHHLERIRERVTRAPRVQFTELVEAATSRVEIIVIFLAVLESIKRQFVVARQSQIFGDIILERAVETEAVTEEELEAEIEEDWA